MKKKNFLSGIGAKLALLTLAISGALMTGCYKDDGLDVTTPGGGGSQVLEDAVYTITGTVTDIETGQDIAGTLTYTGESTPVSFNGSYTVKIAKFAEAQKTISLSFTANDAAYNNGNPINRTVVLDKVEDGQAVVYPLSVAMKKHVTMKQRLYNVTYIFKNAVTGEQITDMPADPTVTPAPAENGLYEAKDYTITTAAVADKYKSSITILSLPYVESEDGKNIDKTVELLITPVDPEKEHTYTTLSGVVVDKNGNSLLAESIKLVGNDNQPIPGKEVANSTNFAFTLDNIDEAGDYKIEATVKGLSAVYSGIYSVPACGNQNITIMVTEEAEMYPVQYTLTYVYKNAVTGENVVGEDFNPTVTPESANGKYEAGEYVITTSKINNKFMSSVTNVTLPYAETKDQKVINKVIVISVTPIDSKQTYTTLSGTIVDNNGRPLTADIDLLKNGQKVTGKSVKGTNFVFTLNDVDDAGDYTISATADGKTVESGVFTVPACGNQVITLGFTEIGLKDVVYNLTFEARDAITLNQIDNAKFVFNGEEKTAATVNPGTYTLSANVAGYFTGTMNIELPAIQNESGEIKRTITIYLTEEEKEVKTVVLMGEVVDALGNMITAQSIKLEGSNLALYNTDHFLFEVELPALTRNNPQWTVTAKVSRTSTPSGKPLAPISIPVTMKYDASSGITAINQNIIIPIVADGNGNITIPDEEAEQGGGEQGSVDPGVDPETGKVEEAKEIVMTGNGTEEDKTVITIDAGTVITTSDGSPLLSPIVLTRNMKEEKDPTVNPEEKEIIQPAVLRSFFGNPDGAQFKEKPLAITFTDPYAGQLGSLQLEYKIDGLWRTSLNNQNNEVATNGQEYTMLVSHFSQFRAVIKGELDSIASIEEYDTESFKKEVNQQNNTDKTENLKITFKDAPTGAIYLDLKDEMEKASFTNENAQAIIKTTINNLFASKGSVISEEFGKQNTDLNYAVAPYTLVKSITVKTKYKTTTYTYTLNGKTINVVVKSVLKHEVTAETVEIGHGHGHGHGNDLNAGGGIIVNE